ncbi:ATP-grasp domain-containing protein [Candidatus Peregrinibacteria bacterium]|nr:ATP-grasp domain-containing protein [Candidatus Peregrinibacteria bacterium]
MKAILRKTNTTAGKAKISTLKIGMTYDIKSGYIARPGDPPDASAEFDRPETINMISESIQSLGFEAVKIGNSRDLLNKINNLDVDIVFNIAEGVTGRNRESEVPVILEMMGMPFIGSDGLSLALGLDKVMAKKVFIAENIPTPRFFTIDDAKANLYQLENLNFPLIVKPQYEGSSKGMSESSKVDNIEQLRKQISYIVKTYKQPAIIEEFISGSEYTVAIIGNKNPEVFHPVQIEIEGELDLGDKFYTFERVSRDAPLRYICNENMDKTLKDKLMVLALKTYRAVDCRDFGRVDFRVDKKGNPYVLEINPLPALSSADVFMCLADYLKIPYKEMIRRILDAAFQRYGMI